MSKDFSLFANFNFHDTTVIIVRSLSRQINLSNTLAKEKNTIPLIMRKCVEEIESRGLQLKGIYRKPPMVKKMKELRALLEKKGKKADVSEKSGIDCYVLAGVLKRYLRELPKSLISEKMFESLCTAMPKNEGNSKNKKIIIDLLRLLPEENIIPLKYIINHLLLVADHSEENLMNRYNLAVPFGPTLIATTVTVADIDKPVQAVNYLLEIWPREQGAVIEL